ncbi:hypothetical protein ACP70R_007677 [Stipagrostis hirtigluma subsp. patula]
MSTSAFGTGTPALSASAIVAEDVEEGSHVLKIEGYSKTKGLGCNGNCIRSGSFAIGGQNWSIKNHPDSENSGCPGWISIYLRSDHARAWQVKARLKFSVIDHAGEPVSSYVKAGDTLTIHDQSEITGT